MGYDGQDRRSGADRRKGPRRQDDGEIAVEAPGGFKAKLTGGRIIWFLAGAGSVMGVWLWTLVKVAH
jgi:hypothetical protein